MLRAPFMRRILLPIFAAALAASPLAGCGSDGASSSTGTSGSSSGGVDPVEFAVAPASCAYACDTACPEITKPYDCPSLGAWDKIPHESTCGSYTGKFPAVAGKCTASDPKGDAIKYAGADPDDPKVLVMPDGRRLTPAGAEFEFTDPRSMTSAVAAVQGTSFVLTVDTGYGDHIVRAVDVTLIGKGNPVVGQVNFSGPESLNQAVVFSPPDRVYVATAGGKVQALKLDTATGALSRDDARSIALPPSQDMGAPLYVSGVAKSADDTRLFISGVRDKRLFVADITAGGPKYGTITGQADLGAVESYGIFTDPHDAATKFAYVTQWADQTVHEVDVSNAAAPKVTRTFKVDKDPQSVAFLDARWMVAGNDLGDTIALIDRVSGAVTALPVEAAGALHGTEPSALAWDEANQRLYATHAGLNAVGAYDVDLKKDPPSIAPSGRLPAQWWPSGVVVMADGAVVITSLMGRGTGPRKADQEYELLHGGIQRVPAPSAADLTAGEKQVEANNQTFARSGYATIDCPAGADDFPIPATNTGKKSPVIEHVFLVVRENKTYDGLFGDLKGGKGNTQGTMVPAAKMDSIWANIRKLAHAFTLSDNFYTSAFISTQGHLWTTHGRTDDFNEREWPVTGYGRSLRSDADSGGVNELGRPEEGSLFDWLGNNNVPYDLLGEIVGLPRKPPPGTNPIDSQYPGGPLQSIGYPDVEKACYVAGRARVLCDIRNVVYMTLPNDHTRGVSDTVPSPETMFAVNDEATGILVDAVSHSAIWPTSLILVTEDDPAQGSESVDYHRTVLVAISPWVKRHYVSHAHADISSVHKLIAHILALPYPNQQVADAALPLDLFTSTPDFTPYDHDMPSYGKRCGQDATPIEKRLTESWDMDDVDEQPGLEAQIDRYLNGRQLQVMPPGLEAEIEAREAAKARAKEAGERDER
jgi:hypothetical protein